MVFIALGVEQVNASRVDTGAHGPDVEEFLVTWRMMELPMLKASRAGWMGNTDEYLFCPAVNAECSECRRSREPHELLPDRKTTTGTVGSLTMFALPKSGPK